MSTAFFRSGVFIQSDQRQFAQSPFFQRLESGWTYEEFLTFAYAKTCRVRRYGVTLLITAGYHSEWELTNNGYTAADLSTRVWGRVDLTQATTPGTSYTQWTEWAQYDGSVTSGSSGDSSGVVTDFSGASGYSATYSSPSDGNYLLTEVGTISGTTYTTVTTQGLSQERKAEDAWQTAKDMYIAEPDIKVSGMQGWELDNTGTIVAAATAFTGGPAGYYAQANALYDGSSGDNAEFDSIYCIGLAYTVLAGTWYLTEQAVTADNGPDGSPVYTVLPATIAPPASFPTPPPYPYWFILPDGRFYPPGSHDDDTMSAGTAKKTFIPSLGTHP